MGRRRSRSKGGRWTTGRQLPVVVVVGLAVYLVALPRGGMIGAVALEIALLLLWYLFVKNTVCDFEGRNGPCHRDAYGKLRGCGIVAHSRGKRAALFATFNLGNPENITRVRWRDDPEAAHSAGPRPSRKGSADAARPENRSQAYYNLVSLAVAAIGSTAGVLALFIDPGA